MTKATLKDLKKDLVITVVLAATAIALGSFTGWIVIEKDPGKQNLKAELEELASRTVLGYIAEGKEGDGFITYSYLGKKMPDKLAPDEILEKRNDSSWTRLIGYENKGTPQEQPILSVIVYPQQTFSQQGDGWYYVEHDTTTQEAINEHEKQNSVAALFWNVAHAADIYVGAGDGYIQNSAGSGCGGGVWNTTRTAASGTTADPTSAILGISSSDVTAGKIPSCSIIRTFLPFDTSSIPAAATISAATLNVYVTSLFDGDNDGADYATIVQTTQATHTTLAVADFDQCGSVSSPTEGVDAGQRKDITSISATAYLTFTLNSTGRGWIKKSGQSSSCSATNGISCFGIREGHDTTNSIPAADTNTAVNFSSSEETGTAQDPYLSVTYTGGGIAFWQFQDY